MVRKCSLILPGFRTTSWLTTVLIVCLETVFLCTESTCSKSFHVHWNTTNSMYRYAINGTLFSTLLGLSLSGTYTAWGVKRDSALPSYYKRFRIDNTDHIIDVNKGNVQFEYDQVNIICPVYTPGTYGDDLEKYIIYNVSKEEYETCRITNPNPRIIAICDKPYKLMYFTITFRPFTPQPGGLEFLPGKDYYFISTSSKDDLHRRIGGRCSTNNMKIVFKVCCAPNENQNNFTTRLSSTSTTTMGWPDGRRPYHEITTSSSTTQWIIRTYPPSTKKPTKKMNEYDKHPNEVMKNEELTYSKAVWLSAAPPSFLVILACIAVIRWR